jgi:hypothetical protein
MDIHKISRTNFLERIDQEQAQFLAEIDAGEIFIVEQFYPEADILQLRERVFAQAQHSEPSWHPLYDDCPDYHRIHDNYPKAHVKSRMHAYYHHGWKQENAELFEQFRTIFDIKNTLSGKPALPLTQYPRDGFIARVNLHQYPSGGGGQAEHIDPNSPYARIQTLVQASQIGRDFHQGGLYARADANSSAVYIDSFTRPGDMMVLSPAVPHGVAPVDPDQAPIDWHQNTGRWIVLPLFVHSDYPSKENVKPYQL